MHGKNIFVKYINVNIQILEKDLMGNCEMLNDDFLLWYNLGESDFF